MKAISRLVQSFLVGYLMGIMFTAILLALCVLGVILHLMPQVHIFPGVTLFRVATLEAKRVHLEVRTPITVLPVLVGLLSVVRTCVAQRKTL